MTADSKNIDWRALASPFSPEDIEWRVQQSGMKGDKPWTKVLAYVANRAIQNRLDDVCGPENWHNEYKPAPDGGILCGISIRTTDGTWVTKWDGAENTDLEAVKGGLSNAMKRSAVQWGIGRYLYKLDATFADVGTPGDHYFQIKDKDTKKVVFTGYWNTPKLPGWAMPKDATQDVEPKPKPATHQEQVKEVFPDAEAAFVNKSQAMTPAQSAKIYKLGRLAGYEIEIVEARVAQLTTSAEAKEAIAKLEAQLKGGE